MSDKLERIAVNDLRIFIEDSFDSAHWLPNVPADHKCHSMHGHTYRVRLEFGGEMDPTLGWLIDYADVKMAWDRIKSLLDHKCLNDLIENSTCENLALFIQGAFLSMKDEVGNRLKRIEIRETERCGVTLDC